VFPGTSIHLTSKLLTCVNANLVLSFSLILLSLGSTLSTLPK
jgi:hypothetical protein